MTEFPLTPKPKGRKLSAQRQQSLLERLWKIRADLTTGANGVKTGEPTLGRPTSTAIAGLIATALKTGAPTVGKGVLVQRHALAAIGVKTGVPTLGKPPSTQVHVLSAIGVKTGAPTLGSPNIARLGVEQIAPLIMAARSRDTRMQHHIATRK